MAIEKNSSTAYEYLAAIVTKVKTDACILWPLNVDSKGYGRVSLPRAMGGKRVFAHRLAYKILHGEWPLPNGLHRCDNPKCFNPRHVFPGTLEDNNEDMVAKGRQVRGSAVGCSKLTEELVECMRKEYTEGVSASQLAARYGISKQPMRNALSGENWKHVLNPVKVAHLFQRHLATHCLKGHLFVKGSFYTHTSGGFTRRSCKICARERQKVRRLTLKEYINAAY